MSCRSTGDPHITTFGGTTFDLMGLDVFPFVALPGLTAQVFHCPATSGWVGASTNVGIALLIEGSTVTIIGADVLVDGTSVPEGTSTSGDISFDVSNGRVGVSSPDGTYVTSIRRVTSNIPTGWSHIMMIVARNHNNIPTHPDQIGMLQACNRNTGDDLCPAHT